MSLRLSVIFLQAASLLSLIFFSDTHMIHRQMQSPARSIVAIVTI